MDAGQLIVGQVMHERLRPLRHRFVYPVFCVRLRLDRLASLDQFWFGIDRWRPLSLRQKDYGPRDGSALDPWIRRQLVEAGLPADGAIWLQTFPRLFGYAFNPVSFWYCHDRKGALCAVLVEVNNTFGEHHRYLLAPSGPAGVDGWTYLQCQKLLHVSPFCEVKGHYQFRFREREGTVFVGIDYDDGHGALIRTSVGGYRQAFSARNLALAVLKQPLLTVGVVARIHWQALKLWLKRVPFYRKPAPPALAQTFTQADESQP